jgi:tRNA-dihydrouridine synthase 3
VIGNGDILFPHEIPACRERGRCAGVMIARGALIKPWIFREAATGQDEDPTPEERLEIYRRYVALGLEHFRDDEKGRRRLRGFLVWHLGFWCRHVPRRPDGSYPAMQEREEHFNPRSDAEALLSRNDPAAHEYLATLLLDGEERAGAPPPQPVAAEATRDLIPEG